MVTTESKAGKAGFRNGLFVSTLQTAAKRYLLTKGKRQRVSDLHKETTLTLNLKPTHHFSIIELTSVLKGYSKCFPAPNFLAADRQHTAAYNSLMPDGREFRATFSPGKSLHVLFQACCHCQAAQQYWSWTTDPCGPHTRTYRSTCSHSALASGTQRTQRALSAKRTKSGSVGAKHMS